MLSLSSHRDAGTTTVAARGDIDLSTVDMLEGEIAAVATGETSTIVVDLSEVTFLDSVGIGVLLKGRRLADERGHRYRVTGATGLVRQVLDLTGVWRHLSGETDESGTEHAR